MSCLVAARRINKHGDLGNIRRGVEGTLYGGLIICESTKRVGHRNVTGIIVYLEFEVG